MKLQPEEPKKRRIRRDWPKAVLISVLSAAVAIGMVLSLQQLGL